MLKEPKCAVKEALENDEISLFQVSKLPSDSRRRRRELQNG
jgi:putative ribosome biogenesis GTPase RsgA